MMIHTARQLLGSLAVSIASLLWGCAISWPAIALPQLRKGDVNGTDSQVDDDMASWIGSSMPIGGTIGGLLTGTCIDVLGRKRFMLLLYLTAGLGWALVCWAPSLEVLCLGK